MSPVIQEVIAVLKQASAEYKETANMLKKMLEHQHGTTQPKPSTNPIA